MFALYLCLLFAYYLTTMNVTFVFFIFENDNCNCIFICLPVGTRRVVSVSDLVYPWI